MLSPATPPSLRNMELANLVKFVTSKQSAADGGRKSVISRSLLTVSCSGTIISVLVLPFISLSTSCLIFSCPPAKKPPSISRNISCFLQDIFCLFHTLDRARILLFFLPKIQAFRADNVRRDLSVCR